MEGAYCLNKEIAALQQLVFQNPKIFSIDQAQWLTS